MVRNLTHRNVSFSPGRGTHIAWMARLHVPNLQIHQIHPHMFVVCNITSPHVYERHIVISSDAYHELISLGSDFIIFHVPILGKIRPVWQHSFSWVQITIFMHVYIVQMYNMTSMNDQTETSKADILFSKLVMCKFACVFLYVHCLLRKTTVSTWLYAKTAATIRYLLCQTDSRQRTVHLLVICIKSDQTPKPQDKNGTWSIVFWCFLSQLEWITVLLFQTAQNTWWFPTPRYFKNP